MAPTETPGTNLTGKRAATHAGSWYEDDAKVLADQLDYWLSKVPANIDGVDVPVDGARVIIAPHAGYSYSGPTAAWAYKSLSISPSTKRVFLLGPSHTYYLSGTALSTFEAYSTPFGDLHIDQSVYASLGSTGKFASIPRRYDEEEHSLEMHIPYLWKMLSLAIGDSSDYPSIVPILIGDLSGPEEKEVGQILKPYLETPENAFIVSSDFCHWGERFGYRVYVPGGEIPTEGSLFSVSHRNPVPDDGQPICDSIGVLDKAAMDAVETGKHDEFLSNLRRTKNTVCGRHPIGVAMAALEALNADRKFKFVHYERSSEVKSPRDSSVSYASAYAIV